MTKWHIQEGSEIVDTDLAFSVKMKLVSEREARQGSTDGMDSNTSQVGQMQNVSDTPEEGGTLDVRPMSLKLLWVPHVYRGLSSNEQEPKCDCAHCAGRDVLQSLASVHRTVDMHTSRVKLMYTFRVLCYAHGSTVLPARLERIFAHAPTCWPACHH